MTPPMKPYFWVILIVFLCGIFSCSDSQNSNTNANDDTASDRYDTETESNTGTESDTETESEFNLNGGELLKSDEPRNTAPAPADEDFAQLTDANTAFALDMYTELRKDNDENLFFSPFSLSVGLTMSYGGAAGTTATQMADTLHLTSLPQETLHQAFNRILLDLDSRSLPGADADSGFELSIANSFWAQTGFPFLDDYLDLISINYGAGIYTMDFDTNFDSSIETINNWIAEQTENKITDALNPDELFAPIYAVLVNAIYFKAAWNLPFDENNTADSEFTLLSGETVPTAMMAQAEHFSYGQGDGYEAIALPYDGEQLEMVLIAPDSGSFSTFEENLNSSLINTILQNMAGAYSTWITMTIPKFHIASKWEMKDIFTAMGMEAPFTNNADFSGMSSEFIRIQKIIHQTDITVNEAGTEAAAATIIVDSNGDADYVNFNLNRPFIFLIRDISTQTILFMGRVTNPSI